MTNGTKVVSALAATFIGLTGMAAFGGDDDRPQTILVERYETGFDAEAGDTLNVYYDVTNITDADADSWVAECDDMGGLLRADIANGLSICYNVDF